VTACFGSSAATLGTDTQTCVTARSAPERCNPLSLPYHSEFAQPCIDAHTNAYAMAQLDAAALQSIEQACVPVFNMGGAQGSVCTLDTDCDAGSGLSCEIHGAKGQCETPTPVAAGGECVDPAADCGATNYCEASGHCVADPGMGETCGPGIGCSTGLRCTTASVCEAQLPDTSACGADTDCVGGICVTTGNGGICAATETFAVGSATCVPFQPK